MINLITGDCMSVMDKMGDDCIDSVITSPPYNISRVGASDLYNNRYDSYQDKMSDEEYISWTIKLFNSYDKILKPNGTVLYNLSYSSENTSLIWLIIAAIIHNTEFTTADTIVWKKKNAIPNNRSCNKLTRICEFVFVFCRKSEIKTFNCNKSVVSRIEKTGQANYENIHNFIEAPNNNGSTKLNKATFSTEFASHLMKLYTKPLDTVYDSFMGTGTTAVAAIQNDRNCVGTELSAEQVAFAKTRVKRARDKRDTEEVETKVKPLDKIIW